MVGYHEAAELAHEAYHGGKTIRALLAEKGVLPADEIDRILAISSARARPRRSAGA
jgi:aspartate ammonia-lyase